MDKIKGHPAYEGTDGRRRYSSNPFAASELEDGGGSTLLPGRFYPGKDSVSIAHDAGWPSGRSVQGGIWVPETISEIKGSGLEVAHTPLCHAEVKNEWSLSLYACIVWTGTDFNLGFYL
jgi:hypothetical protein